MTPDMIELQYHSKCLKKYKLSLEEAIITKQRLEDLINSTKKSIEEYSIKVIKELTL